MRKIIIPKDKKREWQKLLHKAIRKVPKRVSEISGFSNTKGHIIVITNRTLLTFLLGLNDEEVPIPFTSTIKNGNLIIKIFKVGDKVRLTNTYIPGVVTDKPPLTADTYEKGVGYIQRFILEKVCNLWFANYIKAPPNSALVLYTIINNKHEQLSHGTNAWHFWGDKEIEEC
jgi:hypothetical protein